MVYSPACEACPSVTLLAKEKAGALLSFLQEAKKSRVAMHKKARSFVFIEYLFGCKDNRHFCFTKCAKQGNSGQQGFADFAFCLPADVPCWPTPKKQSRATSRQMGRNKWPVVHQALLLFGLLAFVGSQA
jgi:hypothetical protein